MSLLKQINSLGRYLFSRIIPNNIIVWRNSKQKSALISLTFDDGPDVTTTPQLLKELKKCGIKATFFLIGERATTHRDLVLEIYRNGHEIGYHGWAHKSLKKMTLKEIRADFDKNKKFCNEIGILPCRYYRPPYGEYKYWHPFTLRLMNITTVIWNRDGLDYKSKSSEEILDNIKVNELKNGDIILLHEGMLVTIPTISELHNYLLKRNVKLCTVGENIGNKLLSKQSI